MNLPNGSCTGGVRDYQENDTLISSQMAHRDAIVSLIYISGKIANRFGPPEILPSEIDYLGREIGTGTFGRVVRGKCRGKDVAIKILHMPINEQKALIAFKQEVEIMSTIFHPNVCLFMGACTQLGNFFIVSEFLTGGNVERILHDKKIELSLYQRMQMAKDAALGLNWLHRSNPSVIHRDFKSSNLLIDDNGRVKLCDFGLSQLKPPGQHLKDGESAKGTPLWMAPEVMQFHSFNEKSDVYSFGIVLWELLTRRHPFAHHTDYHTFRYAVCVKDERPLISKQVEPHLHSLIERCWHPNPDQRPNTGEILEELDIILINVAINDVYGRLFWTQKYLNRDQLSEVPWSKFVTDLLQFLNIPLFELNDPNGVMTTNLNCFKALLVKKKTPDMVNIQDFGRILNWFGPITSPDKDNRTFLDNVRLMLANPWFHGDIDREAAESQLAGKPIGTFLIRFSSVDGFFTISMLAPEQLIKHQRIHHKPGSCYIIGSREYKTLGMLIQAEGLYISCTGSMYQRIFQRKTQFCYVEAFKK